MRLRNGNTSVYTVYIYSRCPGTYQTSVRYTKSYKILDISGILEDPDVGVGIYLDIALR